MHLCRYTHKILAFGVLFADASGFTKTMETSMNQAANSIQRRTDTADRQCGLIAIACWWRGNWWRLTPPAVPIASDFGVDSSN